MWDAAHLCIRDDSIPSRVLLHAHMQLMLASAVLNYPCSWKYMQLLFRRCQCTCTHPTEQCVLNQGLPTRRCSCSWQP